MKLCVCFPFQIQQNDLQFCLTLVHFHIILLEKQRKKPGGQQRLVDFEIRAFQDRGASNLSYGRGVEQRHILLHCTVQEVQKKNCDKDMMDRLL